MRIALSLLAVATVAILLYDAAHLAIAFMRGREVAAASEAFERDTNAPPALLVLGDSTGVGTGADLPAASVAGRIARDFPELHVENLARNGARYRDIAAQLRSAPKTHYRVILLQAGGNDILRFTGLDRLAEEVEAVLALASRRSDRVIMLATGDVGTAPAIPWPLNYLLSARAERVRDQLLEAALAKPGVEFVDLMENSGGADPFVSNPDRFYAVDGLHPSADGYRLWYEKLRRAVPLEHWL